MRGLQLLEIVSQRCLSGNVERGKGLLRWTAITPDGFHRLGWREWIAHDRHAPDAPHSSEARFKTLQHGFLIAPRHRRRYAGRRRRKVFFEDVEHFPEQTLGGPVDQGDPPSWFRDSSEFVNHNSRARREHH